MNASYVDYQILYKALCDAVQTKEYVETAPDKINSSGWYYENRKLWLEANHSELIKNEESEVIRLISDIDSKV